MASIIVPPHLIREIVEKEFRTFFTHARRLAGPKDYKEFEESLVGWLTSMSGEKRNEARRTFFEEVGKREVLSALGKATAKRFLQSFRIYKESARKAGSTPLVKKVGTRERKTKSGIITLAR